MISEAFTAKQIARLAQLDNYPKNERAALHELHLALEVAETESIATDTIDYILGHSTSTNPRCPLPADIRTLANERNELRQQNKSKGCSECDFTGWRQVIRGGYSGVERCGCQA